jgi:hypothetical protein
MRAPTNPKDFISLRVAPLASRRPIRGDQPMQAELVDLFRRELKDALRPYRAGKKAVAELRESEYLKGDEVIRAVQRELNKIRSKKSRALFSEITNEVALQSASSGKGIGHTN